MSKVLFVEIYGNLVFVMRCLYSAVSLTLVREQRFIQFLLLFIIIMIITVAVLHPPRISNHHTDDRHHDDTSMTSDSSGMTRRRKALGPADSSSERASSKLLVGFIWHYSLLPETVRNTSERLSS